MEEEPPGSAALILGLGRRLLRILDGQFDGAGDGAARRAAWIAARPTLGRPSKRAEAGLGKCK